MEGGSWELDKKEYRKTMINDLKNLTKQQYEQYSYEIAVQLFEDDFWKQAKVIGITVSNHPEVDTLQIIRKAWEQGKKVVVPKCYPKDKKMTFHHLTKFTQLESVYYGLLEPIVPLCPEITANQINLLIVPGLAFSKAGFRLGFGGGYYDRFLADYFGMTISLALPLQLRDDIPIEDHDIPVKKLITCRVV
jgi:5-formyltetrahydrofolate cyclo-ligase